MPRIRHTGGHGSILTAKSGQKSPFIYVGGQGQSATGLNAMTFTLPGVTLEFGDMLVAAIATPTTAVDHEGPGWGGRVYSVNNSPMGVETFACVHTGLQTWSFTPDVSSARAGVLLAYRRREKWNGLRASGAARALSVSTSIVPGITADTDCAFVLFAASFHSSSAPVPTAPANFTGRVTGSGNPTRRLVAFDDLTFSKGEVGSGSVAFSGVADVAATFALLIE